MNNLRRTFTAILFIGVWSVTFAPAAARFQLSPIDETATGSAVRLADAKTDELFKTAFELYRQKKYDEALAICAQIIALDPKDFRPHSLNGLVYMSQWKMKSASEAFARSIALKPDNKLSYYFKAKADNFRNEKAEALVAARKAVELDPKYTEAYILIGDILRYDDKTKDEALAAYRMAIKVSPQSAEAYENMGELLRDSKDEKGAEEAFRKAMEIDPKKMSGRFSLGRLLVKQGRLKEARTVWEERTADEDRTFPNFITLLERAEKQKEATETLAAKPNDPDALVKMGDMVMEGESWVVDMRQERAIEYYKKALKVKPNMAAAQYGIAKAYIQLADTFDEKKKNVDEELAKLRKLDPKLAKELEDYRKTYSGGLKSSTTTINQ